MIMTLPTGRIVYKNTLLYVLDFPRCCMYLPIGRIRISTPRYIIPRYNKPYIYMSAHIVVICRLTFVLYYRYQSPTYINVISLCANRSIRLHEYTARHHITIPHHYTVIALRVTDAASIVCNCYSNHFKAALKES